MRALAVVVAMAFAVSCSAETKSPAPTSSAPFEASDCPVADEDFCASATDAANALAARNADKLLSMSRSGTIICAEMAVEYFPGCATQDVLDGYGLSGPDLFVEIVDEAEYLGRIREITDSIEGTVEIVGVGTCGPDIPGQRTYHLTWRTETLLGSFESTFENQEWRIALVYFGTVERWESEQNDPLTESFCQAGKTQWLM